MESLESGDSLDLLDLLTSQWVAIQTYSFDCGGGGTVFYFFIGKMDQEMAVFWSKTEQVGQFCVFLFYQKTINDNYIISLIRYWGRSHTAFGN